MPYIQDNEDRSFDPHAGGFRGYRDASRQMQQFGYFYRPAEPAHLAPLDLSLLHPGLAAHLEEQYPDGVYRHQKSMIENAVSGQNVISTTPTGSGKTLGFMVPAFNTILNHPDARVIASYPLRALGQDQIDKWLSMARKLGLDSECIQRIDGSVSLGERPKKLDRARILLATPDVLHAWLLNSVDTEETRRFLRGVRLKIVDEVHTYDGVFGTNAMYLFRRMDYIQSMLTPNYDPKIHRQYLGASGTLPDALQNFRQLTDVNATHVGIEENGAPVRRQNVLHASFRNGLAEFLYETVDTDYHQTIVFVDSRAKAEEYTHRIKEMLRGRIRGNIEDAVIPYKAGLRQEDYDHLHGLINSHKARVVVATSALESGIDVDFTFGINIGVPFTKSALLQRMGRVGRRAESTFVVATEDERILGHHTLYDYVNHFPMETPTLYPSNTSLQLAAALCLRNEAAKAQGNNPHVQKPHAIGWPRGFKTSFERADEPRRTFMPHEQHIMPPFKYKAYPQRHLPLRTQPVEHFALAENYGGGRSVIIGDVSAETALREYTPGAIIRHLGEKYRINTWAQREDGANEVVLTKYNGNNSTRSGVVQTIATSLTGKKIFKEQIKGLPNLNPVNHGFLSHMTMRVKLSTTHFLEYAKNPGGGYLFIRPYRYYDDHELETATKFAAENNVDYGPKRHISYDTFGVVLYIPERWFGQEARKDLGEKLVRAYCEKNHISPADIGFAYDRVSVYYGDADRIDSNLLAIYERGGNHIGLLEKFPGQLRQLLLLIASEARQEAKAGDAREKRIAQYTLNRIDDMLRFATGLAPIKPDDLAKTMEEVPIDVPLPEGYVPVLEPGSIAKYARTKTVQETIKILCPALNNGTLGYWVQSIDRKKFYDNAAKWVTVRKEDVGKVVTEQTAGIMRRWQRPDVLNRFVSADYVLTEPKRPTLAMNMADGTLHKVDMDPESKKVTLSEHRIVDESIRSLLTRSLPKRGGGMQRGGEGKT